MFDWLFRPRDRGGESSNSGSSTSSSTGEDHSEAAQSAASGQVDASVLTGVNEGMGNAAAAELLAQQSAAPETSTYTVQSGDTLGRIAGRLLGSSSRYMEIYELNKDRLSSPNSIRVGQVLRIPSDPPGGDEGGQETTAETAPVQETPTPETPVQETPTPETPVQVTPAPETPVQEAPTPESPTPAAEPATYTVQSGDTLGRIAQRVLGDSRRYNEIYELNKDQLSSPNSIRVGQVLRIPGSAPASGGEATAEDTGGPSTAPQGGDQTTEQTATTGDSGQDTAQGGDEEATVEQADRGAQLAITDDMALVRSAPPELASQTTVIPVGTVVEIIETAEKNGREYVKVREVATEEGETGTEWGWTSKGNLGSAKEFDESLEPEDTLDLTGLRGLDRKMAVVYNTKGGYLQSEADRLGIDVAAAAGVLQVESRGQGFSNDGRQIIRFENHVFWDRWGQNNAETFNRHFQFRRDSKRWTQHKWRQSGTGDWETFHGNQSNEHDVLEFARSLDDTAALESISMGAAQIMGFNHGTEGFATVQEMWESFDEGIKPQLEGMFAFIENNATCMAGLRSNNYTQFARGYNGSGQAETYGDLIENAAASYRRVLARVEEQRQASQS